MCAPCTAASAGPEFGFVDLPSTVQSHVTRQIRRAFYTKKGYVMKVALSEALACCFAQQPDVPEDMFELLTAMVIDDDCAAASEWMLKQKELPFVLAEKLVARHGVSAAELTAFAAREDIPTATLQAWVRKERRVTVLAQIAAKPDLPQEVFETLATRNGVALQTALLFNESAPVAVRAGIAAELVVAGRISYLDLRSTLNGSELLQRALFDRLSPDMLLQHTGFVAEWDGLVVSQLHSLLDAVERNVAAVPPITSITPGDMHQHRRHPRRNRRKSVTSITPGDMHQHRRHVNNACRTEARDVARRLVEHPSADTDLLDRLVKFAADYPACWSRTIDEAVATARRSLTSFGECRGPLRAVPYSKLVELADSGDLGTVPTLQRAIRNPLFDTAIAERILKAEKRLGRRDYAVEHLLHDWAPDLASALRVWHALNDQPPYAHGLSKHVAAASTDELLQALSTAADCPEWGWLLAETIAEVAGTAVTDEVVGRFGWFPDHVTAAGTDSRVGALTVDYLHRRFGAHYPTWKVFAAVAGPSTPIADAAALAVHAEPPPPQTTPKT